MPQLNDPTGCTRASVVALVNSSVSAENLRREFHLWVGKIPWRRTRQPTPLFFPREARGQRILAGDGPLGRKGLDTTEVS